MAGQLIPLRPTASSKALGFRSHDAAAAAGYTAGGVVQQLPQSLGHFVCPEMACKNGHQPDFGV